MKLFGRPRKKEGERYHLSEILALIVAALQVILPIVLIILLAVLLAYGLFILIFG